ncbi:hypothetical protein RCL1_006744 [Eukaryota sp. TZLM3-RCL]
MNLIFAPEVKQALDQGLPVVALESTIITHGLPYPDNRNTALAVENVVRENGAIPATLGIINGQIHIGLTPDQLETLAQVGPNVVKASRRDLAFVLTKKLSAGTTVSLTMMIMKMAGISVFATGGIGGVARLFHVDLDISADLTEFSKSHVIVVASGAKLIMDLPNTLEFLETEGVPVIGYQTTEFPAFYSRSSGCKVPLTADNAREVAEIFINSEIYVPSGVLVANPIPIEAEIPREDIDPYIIQALESAAKEGVRGKELTPYLLAKIKQLTEGRSMVANIALIRNNAKVAAQISVELAKLKQIS